MRRPIRWMSRGAAIVTSILVRWPWNRRHTLRSVLQIVHMATVSFRVSEEMKQRMDEHEEINWSAILRRRVAEELDELATRNLAHAVATSERLSQTVDEAAVRETNSADVIRAFRERRYGEESG